MRLLDLIAEHRGESVEEMLGAAVGGANGRERDPAEHGRDIDDVPLAARLEVREHFLHAVERRLDVDAHHLVNVLVRQLRWRPRDALADVVDPDIDLAETREDELDRAAHLRPHRGVADDRQHVRPAARRNRIERVGAPSHQTKRHALL
jgi:hypothetical protein